MVTQKILRMHERKKVFSDIKIRFVSALDLINCLKQIEYAPISELPSNISTMGQSENALMYQFTIITSPEN